MAKHKLKTGKTVKTAVEGFNAMVDGVKAGYQNIEDSVVNGYQAIEEAVVGTYKKIEDKFVDKFLEESPDDTSSEQ